jgi:hypothetical protein
MIVIRVISSIVISVLFMIGIQLLANGIGQKLPTFIMEDQYSNEIQSTSYKGKHLLLFIADRAGSKLTPNFTKILEPKYRGKATFIAVANVSSVPFFLKGFIRGKFKENYSYTVLMDWKGLLWEHFSCKDDVTTVVHIDQNGLAKFKVSGTGTDKELDQIQSYLEANLK